MAATTADCSVFISDRREMRRIATGFILRYFAGKDVPQDAITEDRYLDMVVDTNICDGVDRAYEAMARSGKFRSSEDEHVIGEDIRYVIKTLRQIRRVVPAEFAAGVLLMHLEFVEGVKL